MSERQKLTVSDLDQFLGIPEDTLAPYLEAAAVLAFFDPFTLRPAGNFTGAMERGQTLDYLLPKSEQIVHGPETHQWTLLLSERRVALRRLAGRPRMQAALEANSPRPETPTQRMLELVLSSALIKFESLSRDELAALLTVVRWFDGILTGLPDASELSKALARADLIAPMKRLTEKGFVGRQKELQQLIDYTFGPISSAPLFVYGIGGVGKSTLLAGFVLMDLLPKDAAIAYIDLDRPMIHPQRPLTILFEAVNQLSAQLGVFPGMADSINKEIAFSLNRQEQVRHVSSASASSSDTEWLFEALPRYLGEWLKGRTGVLIVDTMEEAQFLGEDVIQLLTGFLLQLHYSSGLRIILAGRTLPDEFVRRAFQQFPGQTLEPESMGHIPLPYRPINLIELDRESARILLEGALQTEGVAPLDKHEIEEVIDIASCNPMCLHLAARLLRDESSQTLRASRSEFLAKLKAEKIQALLYGRILLNLHGEEVRKVAYPGLIVRRITPEVIRDVLAVPCELKLSPQNDENTIFAQLSSEAALVQLDPVDNSLHHRVDVRRAMLADLTDHVDVTVINAIDSNAIAFYEQRDGGVARAEEIYHRLRRGDPEAVLDSRWIPDAGEYLKNAGDELPAQQRLWLATKMGVTVDDSVRETAGQEAWENQVATAVDRMLQVQSAEKALSLLRERPARLPRSRLYSLEAETLRFLGNDEEALAVARAGVESASKAGATDMALELLLKMVLIEEVSNDLQRAATLLSEAAGVAAHSANRILQFSVRVSSLRLQRKLRPRATEERAALVKDALDFLSPELLQKLRTRPVLLRETATELAAFDAQLAAVAIDTLGLEVRTDEQARALGEAVVRLRKSQTYDPEKSPSLASYADRFEQSNFDPTLIRNWAKDVLTGGETRGLGATLKAATDQGVLEGFSDYFQAGPALESIVLPAMRPVVFVRDESYDDVEAPWTSLNNPSVKARIGSLLPSVGRIEVPGSPFVPYAGTGFLVGKGLIMTARHVAQLFSEGVGLNVKYQAHSVAIDFGGEVEGVPGEQPKRVEVTGIELIHPYWDMALLRVDDVLGLRILPLSLSIRPPDELVGRTIVVIGYPSRDPRSDLVVQDRIFAGTYDVKRLAAGMVGARGRIGSFDHVVNALTHDASTLGGNAGSPVIDVDSGEVIGLHFGGEYLKANYAVPMFELARDRRVAPLLNFSGSVPFGDEWEASWLNTEDTGTSYEQGRSN